MPILVDLQRFVKRQLIRITDICKKRNNLLAVVRRRDSLGKGQVADSVDRRDSFADCVRIIRLGRFVRVGDRIQALAADCGIRHHAEDAAVNGELLSIGRQRAGVFAARNRDLAAGRGIVDDALYTAERVARQGHIHAAGIFHS